MSKSRRQRAEELFRGADTDGSGYVTYKEMIKFLKTEEGDEGIARMIVNMGDQDGDGKLDLEEFHETMLSIVGDDDSPQEEAKAVFKTADTDESGIVDKEKLVKSLLEIMAEDDTPEDKKSLLQEAATMVKACDTKMDGKISLEEFCKLYVTATEKSDG